ncbi:MAG: hypothetical protein J6M18_02615 [Actinomycetaceae bacterium]|nr:hypothetical protein [Actinomycetaceae bacterium]
MARTWRHVAVAASATTLITLASATGALASSENVTTQPADITSAVSTAVTVDEQTVDTQDAIEASVQTAEATTPATQATQTAAQEKREAAQTTTTTKAAQQTSKAASTKKTENKTSTQTAAQTTTAKKTTTSGPAHYTVKVSCTGTQAQIDTCAGATNYKPVSDYLGVPYYAQHNGMGGEAWLKMKVGDKVTVGGKTYTIAQIRTVSTGGSVEQIKGMGGKAYLQTCLDNGYQSKVYALI